MGFWYDIEDIRVLDDDGTVLYEGPKFLRCMFDECASIVTQGMIEETGKCATCGGRKFRPAVLLKDDEKRNLMTGKYPLNAWETEFVGNDMMFVDG